MSSQRVCGRDAYQWCPQERTDTEATNHEGDTERGNDQSNIEFSSDVFEITGNDRTGEGG